MAKRIKMAGTPVNTRAEAEELIGRIAHLTIVRDAETVAMDERIEDARRFYLPRITSADTEIARLTAIAKTWAENNKAEFGEKKSLDMIHAVVGFRTGTPKLVTMAKWTWKRVKEALAERGMGYIRTPETQVDKEKLLADRTKLKDELACVGLKVTQEESFFVEVKRQPLETARIAG